MSNTPDTLQTLEVGSKQYRYYSLPKAADALGNIDRLPKSLKILLENQLRFADDESVEKDDMQALVDWQKEGKSSREIGYRPARVLMQDFTGVPGVVDLASMRAAVEKLGEDPARINPLSPVDLVIDHSVTVDEFGDDNA
ncbi:aconitase family protein, partial [Halomonas sp.]|uniref:aconitase family protein n=1 Tax=Halomonas sp. TaxID=1486246 RepID=UPI003F9AB26C